jgi:hypothetical protein
LADDFATLSLHAVGAIRNGGSRAALEGQRGWRMEDRG